MKKSFILIALILTAILIASAACSEISSLTNTQSGADEVSQTQTTVSESDVAAAEEEVADTLSETATTDYLESEVVEVTAEQTETTEEAAISIDLSTLTADNAPSGTTYKKNTLTISQAGTYLLTGTLNGAISVDKNVEGTVRVILSNATIKTLDSQTSAAIVFQKSDSLRILTVADGTVNEVSDSVGDTEADGDGAAIQAKKCALTINGTGTLKVTAVGEDASGIKVKTDLTVIGTTIEVTAVKNGVKAGNTVLLKEANLTVTAGNDGVKTDVEPETEEEALAYAADPKAGYIYIENSSLTVTAGDDGISADSCLYIANRDSDVITVTTNGGAPATVTERSSDAADGKAIKVGGVVLEDEEGNEVLYPATYDENYAIVVTGGTFRLNSNDDAIHSKGNVLITGGTFEIASGDDGVHAEYLTKITGGSLTVTKAYEGIEGAAVEITGGAVNVTATDDGVNAANKDLSNYSYYILVTGGSLTVDCSGDGVDSNGKLLISGGTVKVFGPTHGGNSALDSETGTTISGGTVIATCREAMDPVASTQYMVTANVNIAAGTAIELKAADGTVILSFTAPKACSNIVISTPDMTSGTYTLTYGTASVTLTATVGTNGRQQGGFGGMGGPNGGRTGRPAGSESEENFPNDGAFDENMTPPSSPNGELPNDGSTPPEIPNGELPQGDDVPPALPNGETPQEGMKPPTAPSGNAPFGPRGSFGPRGNGAAQDGSFGSNNASSSDFGSAPSAI